MNPDKISFALSPALGTAAADLEMATERAGDAEEAYDAAEAARHQLAVALIGEARVQIMGWLDALPLRERRSFAKILVEIGQPYLPVEVPVDA